MGKHGGAKGCGEVYHVFNRSIARFIIFNTPKEYERFQMLLQYYQNRQPPVKFSRALTLIERGQSSFDGLADCAPHEKLVDVISYCCMPTHFHLILKQLHEDGILIFEKRVLNAYTRFFNERHRRKGPLWQGRCKKVTIEGDEQLLHVTRYIHLNPVTAYLVDKPEQWGASSYGEYINQENANGLCAFQDVIDRSPDIYQNFVNDQIAYQRELAKIKHLLLD